MSDMSTYLGDALFNWLKSTAFPADPTNVYAALYDGDPAGAGVEVTGTANLTRQAITFGAIAARAMSNSVQIDFGTANASKDPDYVCIFDASSGGNLLAKKLITEANIVNGEAVYIAAGNLELEY